MPNSIAPVQLPLASSSMRTCMVHAWCPHFGCPDQPCNHEHVLLMSCHQHVTMLPCEGCPANCRRHNADKKIILYTAVAYAVMAAWGVFTQTTAGTQPLIASTVIGGASNVWKLQQIFPPGPSESSGSSGEHFVRPSVILKFYDAEIKISVVQKPRKAADHTLGMSGRIASIAR